MDKGIVQPRLVNAKRRIHQQAVTIKTLDVVTLEGAAIAPDVDVVFLHRGDQHGAGDGAADRRGIEIGNAGSRNMEGTALQCSDAFGHQLFTTVDQTCDFRSEERRVGKECVSTGKSWG